MYPERDAIRSNSETLFSLVADNATPRQWSDWLRPQVEHAAAQGNLDLVATLLRAGANATPGPRGCRGRTLLDAAAEGGNPEVVSALLRAGAKPDVSVRSGSKRRSPLHRAAIGGHDAVALRLIMAGANVCSLDTDKRSPLHLAVRAGQEQFVASLLLGMANDGTEDGPSTKDKWGDAPLHLAAARGFAGIACALMLSGADKNALDGQGRTAMHLAAENGHLNTVNALIDAGANATLRYGENELSVLDCSASNGHIDVLRALLRHDQINVNNVDSTGYTALHMAADNNAAEAVSALIESGAEIESLDFHHWTPLHCAARYNSCREAIHTLLWHGANVQAQETAGEYPLHVASSYLADKAVDLLLRWGADETSQNEDGRTAAEVIGTYAADSDGSTAREREDQANRIRRLLREAPADRKWRRRGIVVLCRRRSLIEAPPTETDGVDSFHCLRQGGEHCVKVPRTDLAVTSHDGRNASAGGGGDNKDLFQGVFCRLIRITEEGLFRHIVRFL